MMTPQSLEALAFLGFALGWAGGELPLFIDDGKAQTRPRWLHKAADELPGVTQQFESTDLDLAAGLPCRTRDLVTIGNSTILWCWVQGSDQVARAQRFKPKPSLVLRMGTSSRRLLIWMLREPAPAPLVESANNKLGYALRAPRTLAKPEALRIPMPGTLLHVGRKRPVPVLCTRMQMDEMPREAIVGRLKDPPAPYMQRLRNGEVQR